MLWPVASLTAMFVLGMDQTTSMAGPLTLLVLF